MTLQVLTELDYILNEQVEKSSAAANYGNSHMISCCIGLINQYQKQAELLHPSRNSPTLYKRVVQVINEGLRHSNP